MSERGDSWCTNSSFSSLLVKLSQVFESAFLDSILKLAWSLLLVYIFLTNFFLPVNFNLICFDTALLEQPPLSVMTLCDPLYGCVKDCLRDHCKQSSPFLWFQRTRDSRNVYCWDGHLMKCKCKYFEILDFWLSLAVSSDHQDYNKKNFWNVLLYMYCI